LARSLGDLAAQFGCELVGDPQVSVESVATLSNAGTSQLSFFANPGYRDQLQVTRAAAVLVREEDAEECPVAALVSDDPYLTYARIAAELHPPPAVIPGVHDAASIDAGANVDQSAQISANVSIDASSSVGAGVFIGPGVVIGPKCHVGSHSQIMANATLVENVVLGERCIVHPNAVIGSDGFGNVQSQGEWVKVPQIGGVRIGNDVEIGANTTIDRGSIDNTIVGDGVRLDNLIQIAHNVVIGAHSAIAAQAGIAGSTIIGERCMFAGQSGVVGHIRICDDVIVGGATVITKNIDEPGFYAGSIPGEKVRDWKRKVARFRRMDDLVKRVSELEERAKKDSSDDNGS
jgi:UDP-3-O-[3-hydroxymyristoyl] glucosamine N-acyltransferase